MKSESLVHLLHNGLKSILMIMTVKHLFSSLENGDHLGSSASKKQYDNNDRIQAQ